ncbi:MAG: DUF285 domain-containing protein [Candidatus Lokiarchaeota archaeon]|nr:DUF285 domain-containing protein [Candidatus Lokiarchaeota archaeon]
MNKKKSLAIIVTIIIVAGISVGLLFIFMQPPGGGNGNGSITGIPFVSTWNTTLTGSGSSNSNQVKLPLESSGTYYFKVDWGDGTQDIVTSWDQAETTYTYASEGVYTVNITGTIIGWSFNNDGDRLKLIDIKQWGSLRLGNSGGYFYGCENLEIIATDILDLTDTLSLRLAFTSCHNLKSDNLQNINEWDVSNVEDMSHMFQWTSFNQSIEGWDVSNVKDMSYMFDSTQAFNQDICNWDVSSVTDMSYMFSDADYFNQNIGNWDVSSVTDMSWMLFAASFFNQDIGDWDVSSVTDMSYMFFSADNFNQDIGDWDVSNVENMQYMFSGASSFDQDLGTWNVSQVYNMAVMFNGVTLSTANYDSLLLGWSSLTLQDEVNFNAGNSHCTSPGAPADARQHIVDTFSWTIYDGDGTHSP